MARTASHELSLLDSMTLRVIFLVLVASGLGAMAGAALVYGSILSYPFTDGVLIGVGLLGVVAVVRQFTAWRPSPVQMAVAAGLISAALYAVFFLAMLA